MNKCLAISILISIQILSIKQRYLSNPTSTCLLSNLRRRLLYIRRDIWGEVCPYLVTFTLVLFE